MNDFVLWLIIYQSAQLSQQVSPHQYKQKAPILLPTWNLKLMCYKSSVSYSLLEEVTQTNH